jgi:hypothetical protein
VGQADGKVIIGGHFAMVGRKFRPSLARLNADGTLDESFRAGIDLRRPEPEDDDDDDEEDDDDLDPTVRSSVSAIVVDGSSGYYIAGQFDHVDGLSRPGLARLLADGSVDIRFAPAAIISRPPSDVRPQIRGLHLLPDGDLVIAGSFTHVDGAQRIGLARIFGLGAPEVISVPDAALEAALRTELTKPTGSITSHDLGQLTTLDLSGRSISNLSGLRHAVNLRALILNRNPIVDLSPLEGLSELTTLALLGNTAGDLQPLLALHNLRALCLESNLVVGANVAVVAELLEREISVVFLSTMDSAEPTQFCLRRVVRAMQVGTSESGYRPRVEWGYELCWPGEAGMTYHVEQSTDCGRWENAPAPALPGTGGTLRVVVPASQNGSAFFRLRIETVP